VVKLIFCAFVSVLVSSLVQADDFKTNDGKEYKNVTVSRVEPDGVVVITDSGILKLYFRELSQAVRDKFHYDEAKAAAFASSEAEQQRAIYEGAAAARRAKAQKDTDYWVSRPDPLSQGGSLNRKCWISVKLFARRTIGD